MATKDERSEKTSADESKRDPGLPGGGKGRKDETSKHGIWPYSVHPHPPDVDPELRTPASLTPNAPYEESGRSELQYRDGIILGAGPIEEPSVEAPKGPEKK